MRKEADKELESILRGCRKQQRENQQALYQLYYAYGMSITIRYVANEAEALTILNDGFLKVFRNIKKFDPQQDFKPWFRRVIINTAINYIKKQKQYKKSVSMEEASHLSDREEILSRISYQELIGMVQSLSLAYRTVFNLYVIDGFKHEEIAKKLGISVSTSKSNLVRARKKLQELVQKEYNTKYA